MLRTQQDIKLYMHHDPTMLKNAFSYESSNNIAIGRKTFFFPCHFPSFLSWTCNFTIKERKETSNLNYIGLYIVFINKKRQWNRYFSSALKTLPGEYWKNKWTWADTNAQAIWFGGAGSEASPIIPGNTTKKRPQRWTGVDRGQKGRGNPLPVGICFHWQVTPKKSSFQKQPLPMCWEVSSPEMYWWDRKV